MCTPEDRSISCRLQSKPSSRSLGFRMPAEGLRLSAEEWELIMSALSAYQHNQAYRSLYEKLSSRAS